MCGIGGIVRAQAGAPVGDIVLRRMAGAMRHRGPDGYGIARGAGAGLVSTRLAIVDLHGGWQPMRGLDGSLLVYNGEAYDHVERRARLTAEGAAFTTTSDTEVVLRLLEREGPAALERLNGQFALAWWEPRARRLTLVRDRLGVRPLHYAMLPDGSLVFASEAKALFASGELEPAPDLLGIDEVFTLWAPRAPRTAFAGVSQLPPGGRLVWQDGRIVAADRWWRPGRLSGEEPGDPQELLRRLRDAVALRLRSDVPVGAYLSGGLDSSLVTALAAQLAPHRLRTFSIVFSDPAYDEREHQARVAQALGTEHHVIRAGPEDIAAAFRATVQACETPLVRAAPAPLWLLARATRERGITVVLSGEGADELFWGYDLFKEVALRELAATDPDRAERLVDELYPELGDPARRGAAWRRALLGAADPADALGSHRLRATATGAIRALYSDDMLAVVGRDDPLTSLRATLPPDFARMPALERAAHLELSTLLSDHLLAAQGDRVAMAHGVEARYPFLDPSVFAYAAGLRPDSKLDGMRDKALLRDAAASVIGPVLAGRRKQPYRAPGVEPFITPPVPDWVRDALAPEALRSTGIFAPARVDRLLRRAQSGRALSARESMAFVGVLSTQVWDRLLCRSSADHDIEPRPPRVVVDEADRVRGAA